jgi:hypothetical protein
MKNKTILIVIGVVALIALCICIVIGGLTLGAASVGKTANDAYISTRNSQRNADVNAIANAVAQYTSEKGALSIDISECSTGVTEIGTGAGNADLATILVDNYLITIPKDPMYGDDINTGYTICKDGNKYTITAPKAEGQVIQAKI